MSAGHRHSAPGEHEHEFESSPGLPEPLPAGERVLWQGSPDWKDLAVRAFHARKVAIYFGVILALRAAFVLSEGGSLAQAAIAMLWLLPLAAFAVGTLVALAWLTGRTAVYTITDKRVVMRIGIVLTLTFNLPFKRIAGAGVKVDKRGRADIPLQIAGSDRIAWLHLWPHARPWKVARSEPMLRSVPDGQRVAQILTRAWSQANAAASAPTSVTQAGPAVVARPQTAVAQPLAAAH